MDDNDNNVNDSQLEKIFFSVWRNIVIKNEIFEQLRKFKIYGSKIIKSYQEFIDLQYLSYKTYITTLTLDFNFVVFNLPFRYVLKSNDIPYNVNKLILTPYFDGIVEKDSIPNNVQTLICSSNIKNSSL